MRTKKSPVAWFVGFLLAINSLTTGHLIAAETKPNVLIVMTDDQGSGDFSYTGNPVLKTPNLDRFAADSIRLTDFHVCPMCTPTRGQLLTGICALRNGATSVTAGRTFLRPGLSTMAERFSEAGYRTGLFGKWHLGDTYPHRPVDKGFTQRAYHLGWGMLNSTPEFDNPLFDGHYQHNELSKPFRGHCTDLWFDLAMAWMRRCTESKEPFFCYLPTNAPHAPHIDLEEDIKPYRGKGPAGFFGMIAHIDRRFGDLERFLEDSGLKQNTIVIFMTDNGGTAGVATHNAGLRAGKTTYYEGGHRVPCWIRWPDGKLGSPRDISVPTMNIDIYPTLMELAGMKSESPSLTPKEQKLFGGVSLAGLLRGSENSLADRMLVVQYGQIIKPFDSCVIWNQWRLVGGKELYDVHTDRSQSRDIASDHPDMVQRMRQYYENWWNEVQPLVDEFVPISIGANQQPTVELTSGDWEGIYADNTGHVRNAVGGPTGGHWNIQIEQPGTYLFTLRRWPRQTGIALGASYDAPEMGKKAAASRSFANIAEGRLEIRGDKFQTSKNVSADPKKGETPIIAVELPAGRVKLKAWFSDAAGEPLCGAYFVNVGLEGMFLNIKITDCQTSD